MVLPNLVASIIAVMAAVVSAQMIPYRQSIVETGDAAASSGKNQPVVTLTIGFVLPSQSLTDARTREQLRQFLAVQQQRNGAIISPITPQPDDSSTSTTPPPVKRPPITYRLRVNPVYAVGVSLGDLIKNIFCSRAAEGVNALFVLVDKSVQGSDGTRVANFVTTLANTAGVPTMAWSNAAHELEDTNNAQQNLRFLLAPPTRSQAHAIFAFLQTYQWRRFSILASGQTPGYDNFLNELRVLSHNEENRYSRFTFDSHQQHMSSRIIRIVKFTNTSRDNVRTELLDLRDNTDTRIVVLYSNHYVSNIIFEEARMLGMTSGEYLWICARAVLGDSGQYQMPTLNFIPGTIAVTYNMSMTVQLEALKAATKLWSDAIERLVQLPNITIDGLAPRMSCDGSATKTWAFSNTFYNLIKSTPVRMFQETNKRFDDTGLIDIGSVSVLNLDSHRQWKKIGEWTRATGLLMDDITWPGGPGKPPSGRPDSTILKIATLEEPPYVVYEPPDPISGVCPRTAVPCRLSPVVLPKLDSNTSTTLVLKGEIGPTTASFTDGSNRTRSMTSYNFAGPTVASSLAGSNGSWVCCVGFCMDLLRRLSTDIGFRFELYEVHDRKWGAIDRITGQWNGLVQALLDNNADMVVTSLKISKERSTAIDFSIPFLETGITILVRVREGVISPVAFLEPFSVGAWVVVLIGCVNACAVSTFLFEYFSPRGLDRGKASSIAHKFSLFRSLWLVWVMLFKAAVRVDIPRGIGARLMANTWGMFCVIFMSSYMANLAAFMITKEDFYDFSGIDDYRLKNPYSKNPPWKYATIPSGATEAIIKHNFPDMFEYMRMYNRSTADDGMWAVKKGDLDAFIYDATVLEYKAGRDKECRLRTVGKWYAMTGYGIAFPKGSKWLSVINKYIIDYQHTGYLQQLQEFWLTGACKERQKQESTQSQELGILNFTSAFIMLAVGLFACTIFLLLEHIYFKYGRRHLRKIDRHCGGICGLISLSMGASLSFKDTVQGALWRLQSDPTPCTNNSCQFHQEFLKAQLRKAKSHLRVLESHLGLGAAMKRETTFGADDPQESPVVNFMSPLASAALKSIKSASGKPSPSPIHRADNGVVVSSTGYLDHKVNETIDSPRGLKSNGKNHNNYQHQNGNGSSNGNGNGPYHRRTYRPNARNQSQRNGLPHIETTSPTAETLLLESETGDDDDAAVMSIASYQQLLPSSLYSYANSGGRPPTLALPPPASSLSMVVAVSGNTSNGVSNNANDNKPNNNNNNNNNNVNSNYSTNNNDDNNNSNINSSISLTRRARSQELSRSVSFGTTTTATYVSSSNGEIETNL